MKQRLLQLAYALTLTLTALRLSVFAQPTVPTGPPEATVDLATDAGVQLVNGQWRYSDVKIVETEFKAAGTDGQPSNIPNKTYDITPKAGGIDFDDSKWEALEPTTLQKRRTNGRIAFNWYRIKLTIPERVGASIAASTSP